MQTMRVILQAGRMDGTDDMHKDLGLNPLPIRREQHLLYFCHKNIYTTDESGQ